MEFQLSYFTSEKMMLWKCCTQYASKFRNLSRDHRTRKRSVVIPIPKKGNAKECQNTAQLHLSHTLANKYSNFSKPALCMWNVNFQMFKLDLEKAEEPKIKLPPSFGSSIKQESSRKKKKSTYALLTMLKPLTVWITKNFGKFFKRWAYQTTLPAS